MTASPNECVKRDLATLEGKMEDIIANKEEKATKKFEEFIIQMSEEVKLKIK